MDQIYVVAKGAILLPNSLWGNKIFPFWGKKKKKVLLFPPRLDIRRPPELNNHNTAITFLILPRKQHFFFIKPGLLKTEHGTAPRFDKKQHSFKANPD